MKAFIVALAVFVLLAAVCIANDIYCHKICQSIIENVSKNSPKSAEKALQIFRQNELLLKSSVDAGYIVEARVSLESLISAYECNDEYEISRYIRDIGIRTERIKKSLFI